MLRVSDTLHLVPSTLHKVITRITALASDVLFALTSVHMCLLCVAEPETQRMLSYSIYAQPKGGLLQLESNAVIASAGQPAIRLMLSAVCVVPGSSAV